jgi:hypothetical protein
VDPFEQADAENAQGAKRAALERFAAVRDVKRGANRSAEELPLAMFGPSTQQHPLYHAGFYDAQNGEPLFDDAHPVYAMGWRAFWTIKEALAQLQA